ncbi:MAG TPA: hypothetical protein VE442_14775 [Jatrophihabitans sp.]|jgi:hypothetical protein|nr:hypothetical protein [Jatrophihabitans sp.]
MSPSEDDLRSALHEGDSKSLDVDRLVLHARARVAQRRMHLLSGAAITVLVAAVGVGGAFLVNSGGSESGSASGGLADRAGGAASLQHSAGKSDVRNAPGVPAASTPVAGANADRPLVGAVACPQTLPNSLVPRGGGPGKAGARGPLFKKPVAAVVVCAYGSTLESVTQSGHYPVRLVLTGKPAQQLAASLENAPSIRPEGLCPDYRLAAEQRIAIIGVDANGKQVGTVTTTVGRPPCDSEVTNGTVVRYAWTPPAWLERRLLALTPTAAPKSTAAPSPTN